MNHRYVMTQVGNILRDNIDPITIREIRARWKGKYCPSAMELSNMIRGRKNIIVIKPKSQGSVFTYRWIDTNTK